jgi:hypothetical protein
MKTYPTNTYTGVLQHSDIFRKAIFLFFLLSVAIVALCGNGGTNRSLIFKNAVLESGAAGADGAVYRFPQVDHELDALVKITGRSGALVKLLNIDMTNTGWNKAFQPQITYNNGNATSATEWWMEFEISFVKKGTSTLVAVNNFDVTGSDIDGNGNKVREFVSFYKSKSYLLESSSLLKVNNQLDFIVGLLTPGKKFEGPVQHFTNIDTSATGVTVSNSYENINKFRVRTGAVSSGANSGTDRMYSLSFKSFTYQNASEFTLPLVLNTFHAALNSKKVILNWVTGQEKNLNYFAIERSTNGVDYTDAGFVFAVGNTGVKQKYAFSDAINTNNKGVLYYRLRMVDTENRTQHSAIRMIKTGDAVSDDIQLTTFPNPVVSQLRITIPAQWQNKAVNYDVYNANGVLVKHVTAKTASQIESVDMQHLGTGMYVVKASTGTEIAMQRIVKN